VFRPAIKTFCALCRPQRRNTRCQEWLLVGVSTCRCFDRGNKSAWESSTVRSRKSCFKCIGSTVQASTRSQKWPPCASSVAPFTLMPTPATAGGSSVATAALPSIAIHARPADVPSTAEIPPIRDALTAASEDASVAAAGAQRSHLIECHGFIVLRRSGLVVVRSVGGTGKRLPHAPCSRANCSKSVSMVLSRTGGSSP